MKKLAIVVTLGVLILWSNHAHAFSGGGNGSSGSGGMTITSGTGDFSACAQTGASLNCTVTKTNGASFGTAATVNTGTSGATLGLLNGNLTFGGADTFSNPPTMSGANITGSTIPNSALATDPTNASNLSSGTVAAARGGAGAITGALKANGAGVVSQAACADLSNASASCSTDATNASNISSGTVPAGRMPAFTGDCTTSAGAVATTCTKSSGNLFTSTTFGASLNLSTYTGALGNGATGTTQAASDNSTKLATTAYADRAAGAWAGPLPIAYEGVGQGGGASNTLNAASGVSANNDLVVICTDTSTGAGAATLTCGGGCTNTFTKRLTDYNVASGEFYTCWTGLAGSETSYTVTDAGNTVYLISMAVMHKASGVTAWDAINHSLPSPTSGLAVTPTLTTTQNNATVLVLLSNSGAGATHLDPMSSAFSATAGTIFPLIKTFQTTAGSTGFFGLATFQMAASGTFPGVTFQVSGGNGAGAIVLDVY